MKADKTDKPKFQDLTDPNAVLKAIKEFDKIGRDAFLKKYDYGKARDFFLVHDERLYDSKAIVGAAYEHQHDSPLRHGDFVGGAKTVVPKLKKLGFEVVDITVATLAEEVPKRWEGKKHTISVNAYERSTAARKACIKAHGCHCAICGFDFGQAYGAKFQGFIHVHHLVPLSEVGKAYKVDPAKDLIPLCPNCHAVVHYGNDGTRTVDEVKELRRVAKKQGL